MAATAVSFDCYGTLIDAAGGRGGFFYGHAMRQGLTPEPGPSYAARWGETQRRCLAERFRPYEEVVREVNRRFAEASGWKWNRGDDARFLESMNTYQPFPEARPVIDELCRAGVKIVVISNSSSELLKHSLAQFGGAISLAISGEEAAAYKPDLAPFRLALSMLGATRNVLHVAAGYEYDIPPARSLGLPTMWIDRVGGGTSQRGADYIGRTLWDVLGVNGLGAQS